MDMMKGRVENTIMDVITPQQYFANPNMYNNMATAVMSQGMMYPIRNGGFRNEVGCYPSQDNKFIRYVPPTEKEYPSYTVENNTIDFSNMNNLKDVIENTMKLEAMERQILTTPDNIFIPMIREEDSPEMRIMKQAIIDKEMDIDKYKPRIPQFTNDKRLFNNNTLTLDKFVGFCNAFDIKATLTLEDKNPNVPNPMGTVRSIELTSGSHEAE